MAEVIDIRGGDEQAVARAVTRAAAAIADGELVAVPAEAGYQLIASISDPAATDALQQASLPTDRLDPVVLGTHAESLLELVAGAEGPGWNVNGRLPSEFSRSQSFGNNTSVICSG